MQKYFDYAATTPCAKEVVEAMSKYWEVAFGNPHSRSHSFGWEAENAIEEARKSIAELINADPKEMIFTSGATESNNLAIKGFANGPMGGKKKIISCTTEHKCVIESLRYLKNQGFEIVYLPVNEGGLIDLNRLEAEIDEAMLVSISFVNNETGVMQPIEKIGQLCRDRGVFFHVDAAQAFGKVKIDVKEQKIDMLSISGHKIYGPMGIGALFVSRNPRVRLANLLSGGGQERGMRSGTLPTPLCVGFGEAAKIASKNMEHDYKKASAFHEAVYKDLILGMDEIYLNGSKESKIPHIMNISIPFVEGESMMMRMRDFALASGSACTSKSLEPSHVIRAMYPGDQDLAHSSIRVCFGRLTTKEEVGSLIEAFKKNIKDLRAMSPLWDMKKRGIDLKTIVWNIH